MDQDEANDAQEPPVAEPPRLPEPRAEPLQYWADRPAAPPEFRSSRAVVLLLLVVPVLLLLILLLMFL
jgi:hypothetical protein